MRIFLCVHNEEGEQEDVVKLKDTGLHHGIRKDDIISANDGEHYKILRVLRNFDSNTMYLIAKESINEW